DVEWVRDNTAIRVERVADDHRVPHAMQTPVWSPRAVAGVEQATALYGVTGAGVRVCVLDTGVDATHPDIAPRMVTRDPRDPTFPGGWASISSTGEVLPPSEPYDSEGHGTHVSGVVVAGTASGYAIGVAPGAGLMHALVLPGGEGRMAQVIGGMQW